MELEARRETTGGGDPGKPTRQLQVETGAETTELGVETQAETTGLERLRWRPQTGGDPGGIPCSAGRN